MREAVLRRCRHEQFSERAYRCPTCGRLWFRAHLPKFTVLQIRCPKCGLFYVIGNDNLGLFVREDTKEGDTIPEVT